MEIVQQPCPPWSRILLGLSLRVKPRQVSYFAAALSSDRDGPFRFLAQVGFICGPLGTGNLVVAESSELTANSCFQKKGGPEAAWSSLGPGLAYQW